MLLNRVLQGYEMFELYYEKNRTLTEFIDSAINKIVTNMIEVVDFNKMVTYISQNFGKIPMNYFSEHFAEILVRYGYQRNIFRQATNLMNNDVEEQTKELVARHSQGVVSS